ncbi:hypothetical protein OKW22_000134 [Bacilli bacterium PM5-3]|nr:hypothetical protein [Bacilli bacterium PM5-3]
MILKNINNTDLDIELNDLNYICPIDIVLGNEMYDYLTKYFSNYKYDEDYLAKYNNVYPEIILDNQVLKRDEYICIGINSYKDIDELLQSKKGTLFYDYNNKIIDNVDVKKEIEIIETAYINITNKISQEYENSNVINIKDFILKADKLLSKEIEFSINYVSSISDKFKLLMELFSVFETQKVIFYLNNVDSYLSLDDMKEIVDIAKSRKNIKIIIQSNNSIYLDYTDTSKVIFLIKNKVENLPNNYLLLKKINNNICSQKHITDSELIEWFKKYSTLLMEDIFAISENDFDIYNALKCKKYEVKTETEYELENSIII